MNGVNGGKYTSMSNGGSIFLPAAGYRNNSDLYNAGSIGNYWSSTQYWSYTSYAYYLYFYSGGTYTDYYYYFRNFGQSVRPVSRN